MIDVIARILLSPIAVIIRYHGNWYCNDNSTLLAFRTVLRISSRVRRPDETLSLRCQIKPENDEPGKWKKDSSALTAHNWQNWERVLLSSYCHGIYRVEAVGLKIPIILKNLKFWRFFGIWGNFLKNRYFANYCLIKVQNWKCFCTHVTYIIVVIFCTTNFVSIKSNFS